MMMSQLFVCFLVQLFSNTLFLAVMKKRENRYETLFYLISSVTLATTGQILNTDLFTTTYFAYWQVSIVFLQLIMSLSLTKTKQWTIVMVTAIMLVFQLIQVNQICVTIDTKSTLKPHFQKIMNLWDQSLHLLIPIFVLLIFNLQVEVEQQPENLQPEDNEANEIIEQESIRLEELT